ncbi:unnamed protein product [Symbiodinium microadriaticum]|nr:unnamed protein product [Symbiodinium microadriaticum]
MSGSEREFSSISCGADYTLAVTTEQPLTCETVGSRFAAEAEDGMAICDCLEGTWTKIQELLLAAGISGIAKATHHDLLDLVTELESIQESRVSVDQGLLADLIRKYDSQVQSSLPPRRKAPDYLPFDLPVDEREYKMLPLPSETLRPILEGANCQGI